MDCVVPLGTSSASQKIFAAALQTTPAAAAIFVLSEHLLQASKVPSCAYVFDMSVSDETDHVSLSSRGNTNVKAAALAP
jgi:hypothetical protein